MTCPTCHSGEIHAGTTTVTLERDSAIVVIRNVPATVCDTCGDYSLAEAVAAGLCQKAESAINRGAEVEILSYVA
ncbi:MAG: type II toxin-antitoxin system MqsA family antitoxin [Candidatus Hydrogenedentes bacterium]|nr:type II toxin-antitoxin system MqsA family antitoxin [Candidatus Hydrogenedentota bacterium]